MARCGESPSREVWSTRAASATVRHLSLHASPFPGSSWVRVRFFVFLHGLPENRVDLFEMVDACAEFSLFSHQHSIASLQLLKAQAQRVLLAAPVRALGRTMASLHLKLFDRRVEHPAVFEQIKRLREMQRLRTL